MSKRSITLAAVFSLFVLSGGNAAYAQTQDSKIPATWGKIKAIYGESQASQGSPSTPNEQARVEQPSYQPWTLPAAQAAIQKFNVNPNDVLAVQRVVPLRNGMPLDDVEAVVTEKQWYYYRPSDGTITNVEPPKFGLATEMDVYGSNIECVKNWWFCPSSEWVATFYMPACFHEDSPGYFSEIADAWAPNPDCSRCNGGACAGWVCGSAWDGPGYLGWYNYKDCDANNRNSKKLGKLVQKRWLFTQRNCGYADWQIASSVRAHLRY